MYVSAEQWSQIYCDILREQHSKHYRNLFRKYYFLPISDINQFPMFMAQHVKHNLKPYIIKLLGEWVVLINVLCSQTEESIVNTLGKESKKIRV